MKLRRSRQARKGRIEIIPMIDVMFFLLATFILSSLALQNLHSLPVDLPRGKAAPMQAQSPVTLTIARNSSIFLNRTPVTLENLAGVLQPMLRTANDNIIVAADQEAAQGTVVQAMLAARQAGAQHFIIAVKYHDR